MDRMIYVAMTGAREILQKQALTANNLANANTTGFRADQSVTRALPVFNMNLPTRAYAMTQEVTADFSQGPLQPTGRDLDVAIKGPGWIALQTPDGEGLTRDGSLHLSPSGLLESTDGRPVLGNNGPISLPPLQSLSIGADGTISGVPQGQPTSASVVFDRIRLVNPPEAKLQKGPDGLFRASGGPIQADANVTLAQGMLEGSNVNPVSAMVDMISMSRQFETQIKLIQTARDDARNAAQILNLNG